MFPIRLGRHWSHASFVKIFKSYIKIFWQFIQKHWRENRWQEVGDDLSVCVLDKALSILLVVSLTSLKKKTEKVKHKLLMHVQNEYRVYSEIYSESLESIWSLLYLKMNSPCWNFVKLLLKFQEHILFLMVASKFWMNI